MLLDDLGIVIRVGPIVTAVPHSHMLRHRQRRLRKKWRKRLAPAMRAALTAHTLGRLTELAGFEADHA